MTICWYGCARRSAIELKIGGRWFRIAAVIEKEPDRMTAGVGLGPRVMMTRRAMDETGLLQPGSRATERYLFALGDKLKVADVRAQIEKILPDAQVTDFRETSPTLTQGVDRATGLLSLICLVAMVLGAIGVAMAMRAHLQQRIEILAIMKSIGARSADILRIYLLQTLLLGVGGRADRGGAGAGRGVCVPDGAGQAVAAAAGDSAAAESGAGGAGDGSSDDAAVLLAAAAGCAERAAEPGAAEDGGVGRRRRDGRDG